MTARLVLFDIDGTLVLTGGAGKRSMDRAFAEIFGIADAFADVAMGGRTDRFLIERALGRWDLPITTDHLARFRERYVRQLAEEIHQPGRGTKSMMPGVAALLDAIDQVEHVQTALLTGNYAASARIKLEHFDLWHRFPWGAFGDDHADRDALARAAIAAAPARGVHLQDPAHAVVIGDTPFDIACARAAGARVIAVATGAHTVDELRALGPDAALADLQDIAAVLEIVARD